MILPHVISVLRSSCAMELNTPRIDFSLVIVTATYRNKIGQKILKYGFENEGFIVLLKAVLYDNRMNFEYILHVYVIVHP